jgi:hypothetical protein
MVDQVNQGIQAGGGTPKPLRSLQPFGAVRIPRQLSCCAESSNVEPEFDHIAVGPALNFRCETSARR